MVELLIDVKQDLIAINIIDISLNYSLVHLLVGFYIESIAQTYQKRAKRKKRV